MSPFRPPVGVSALAILLTALLFFVCGPPDGEPGPPGENRRLVGSAPRGEAPRGDTEGKTLSAAIRAGDERGAPIPGLPRYPGSVRTAYSEDETGGLVLIRAEYLTGEKPGAVNGFWRDAFRSGGWQVANVEYSDGWDFLVLRGEREAEVGVLPRGGGSEVRVEFSAPAAGGVAQEEGPSAGGSKR